MILTLTTAQSASGHFFGYHRVLGEAFAEREIGYRVALPSENDFSPLPEGWCTYPFLAGGRGVPRFLSKWLAVRKFGAEVEKMLDLYEPEWLLAEYLRPSHLYSLLPLLRKRGTKFCLHWVCEASRRRSLLEKHARVARDYKKALGLSRFCCTTDSCLLREVMRESLQMDVTLLPVCAVDRKEPVQLPEKGPVRCWWAGAPRKEKGIAIVQALAEAPPEEVELVVPESMGGRAIHVADRLSEVEYQREIERAHILLFPYNPKRYGLRSSGIFVEAVAAGRVPLVSRGTWMEHELNMARLPELVVSSWEWPKLLDRIATMREDPTILSRLQTLQERYAESHTGENLAEQLLSAFASTKRS